MLKIGAALIRQPWLLLLVFPFFLPVCNCGLVGLMRDKEEQLLPLVVKVLQSCVEDKSWRVRYMLAEQSVSVLQKLFLQISDVLFASQDAADAADDDDATLRFLRIVYVPLLTDEEAEVRCLALSKLPQLAQAVAKGAVGEDEAKSAGAFLLKVKPQLEKLAKDGNTGVRMSLAGSLLLLAPLVGAVTTASHLSVGRRLIKTATHEIECKHLIDHVDRYRWPHPAGLGFRSNLRAVATTDSDLSTA